MGGGPLTLHLVELELDPIDGDPRPCELCGCTIDRHEMVDDGEARYSTAPIYSPTK